MREFLSLSVKMKGNQKVLTQPLSSTTVRSVLKKYYSGKVVALKMKELQPQKQTVLLEPFTPQCICHCVTKRCSNFADRLASVSKVIRLSAWFTCAVMALPTLIMCSHYWHILLRGHTKYLVSILQHLALPPWMGYKHIICEFRWLCSVWFGLCLQLTEVAERLNVIYRKTQLLIIWMQSDIYVHR